MRLQIITLAVLPMLTNCDHPKTAGVQPRDSIDIGNSQIISDTPQMIRFEDVRIKVFPGQVPYPSLAMQKGVQGDVLIEVWVDINGKPQKATPLWGPHELRDAAVSYFMKWRFQPYQSAGKTIPFRFRMSLPFLLQGGSAYQKLPNDLLL